ncbi:hypothetical protein [Rhizobium sp. SSA_523]|uniref:hypothetical protein n=1 Tax=Rhizobium sp. SSA_523 TaxID=2952477 RepID=UPI0020900448|nr:hypothetical protein [Rhizobium sp. SSA_523]MCO5734562.1 hypothetical protein [Rhizobium sp. SSA_523]WKC23344.1 hypothetical protein QTJ18_21410 [Rhizobium sp. SSA_523]
MSFSSFDTLDTKDLNLLRKVLEEVCAERDWPIGGAEAEEAARSLVDWYLFGIRHPDQLKQMLAPLPAYLAE